MQSLSILSSMGSPWIWVGISSALLGLLLVIITISYRKPTYRRRAFMTPNEIEFDRRLKAAVPELDRWPQVPMFALIEPKAFQGSPAWKRAFREISNRRVDWVIAENGIPLVIIELDDATHRRKNDNKRDRIFASGGYPVIRYQSNSKPAADNIRDDIYRAISDA